LKINSGYIGATFDFHLPEKHPEAIALFSPTASPWAQKILRTVTFALKGQLKII